MYRIHDGNTTVYETLDELLRENIHWATECEGFYYIKLIKELKDDAIWKVDKQTSEASYMQYPMYLVTVMDKAKEIDPATLRRGA